MRKLVMLGGLAGIFAIALVLETLVTHAPPEPDPQRLVMVLGGGPPVEIPETPPARSPKERAPRGRGLADPLAQERQDRSEPAGAAPLYEVQSGETLSEIARKMLGDASRWPEIQALNGIQDPKKVLAGARLKLPRP